MSLDISVMSKHTGESMDMNWLRNPFGLCPWAEANYNYATERQPPEEQSLWYVINHWNYDTSDQVDKPLFLEVVKRYGVVLHQLERGYFFFTETGLEQFVWPCVGVTSMVEIRRGQPPDIVTVGRGEEKEYGLPMEKFGDPCYHLSDRYRPHAHTLGHYLSWYRDLIRFAEILQEPDASFYCSN